MADKFNPPGSAEAEEQELSSGGSEEPFACPHCGQMLAPTCRVCVSCRQPIDPAQIRRPEKAEPSQVHGAPAQELPPWAAGRELHPSGEDESLRYGERAAAPPPVRYPWRAFLVTLGLAWVGGVAAVEYLGVDHARMLFTGIQIAIALWVFFDARQRRLPKPAHWGLGTLFLWIIVFPWYVIRRRTPERPCPFVEREPSTLARIILAVLALFFLVAIVTTLLHGPK